MGTGFVRRNIKYINLRLLIGLTFLVIIFVLGFVFPLFYDMNPLEWNQFRRNMKPSGEHWLGTTSLGQDTFWLLCFSLRNSLIIGLFVALFATIIGVALGLTAGFVGGAIDRIITLIGDSFIVIPQLPILILISSLIRGTAPLALIILVLIVFNWPWPARQVRSMALSIREQDFVEISRFSGNSTIKILRVEILPFVLSWSVANFINTILVAIATESGLAVIGLMSNTTATLGTMIYWANQHQAMLAGRWYWIGSPSVILLMLFLGLFLTMTGYQQFSTMKRGQDA